ncbi:hypothetical protein HQ545_05565 [Candidatus Woesearchaeota archaeon]|nr:hypothetical protein [Candidatus Woesearchaeota archaeon]
MDRQTPVFVKVDEYKDVLNILDLIKNKISDAKGIISEINDLKNQEDSEIALWSNEISEMERKIEFIDQTLLEPENV